MGANSKRLHPLLREECLVNESTAVRRALTELGEAWGSALSFTDIKEDLRILVEI